MSKNYYEELIAEVNNLISNKYYEQAQMKVYAELELPYIPPEYEQKFHELANYLSKKLAKPRPVLNSDWNLEKIKHVLANPFDEEIHPVAFFYLSKQNARLILPEIRHYLSSEIFLNINKVHLLELLKKQEIYELFEINNKNGSYKCNPKNLIDFENNKLRLDFEKLFNENVYNDNPGYYKIGMFVFDNYIYEAFPNLVDFKKANVLAAAILSKVEQLQFQTPDFDKNAAIFQADNKEVIALLDSLKKLQMT